MSKQSYRDLKSLAKTQGIKGYYKMKKAELLKELKIDESADTSRKTMNQKRKLTDQKLLHYYCIHDRYKYQCRSCQGSGYCKQDRQLYLCKECAAQGTGGKGICQHNKRRYICVDCNGKGVCNTVNKNIFVPTVTATGCVSTINVKIFVRFVQIFCYQIVLIIKWLCTI